jgi:hypothetical protein
LGWDWSTTQQKSMDRDLTRFIECQLKTRFCPKFDHKSTQFFENSIEKELASDFPYRWPPERVHRYARDTHHSLGPRSTVSDDDVLSKEIKKYEPNWAKEVDQSNGSADGPKNPHGRFGFPSLYLLFTSVFQAYHVSFAGLVLKAKAS